MTRNTMSRFFLACLVLPSIWTAAPCAFAEKSPKPGIPVVTEPRLGVRASVHEATVTMTGRLADGQGRPLAGKVINLMVNRVQIGLTRTNAKGYFTVKGVVPPGTPLGDHAVQVAFPGDGVLPGTAVEQVVRVGNVVGTTIAAVLVAPTRPPAGSLPSAKAGEWVRVQGRLVDARRRPIARALLMARDSSGNWIPEMASDAQGNFSGRFDIAAGSAPGPRSMTVVYRGDDAHAPASRTVRYTVAPGGFTPAPEPSRSPRPSAGGRAASGEGSVEESGAASGTGSGVGSSAASGTASGAASGGPSGVATTGPVPSGGPTDGGTSEAWWSPAHLALAVLGGLGLVSSLLCLGHTIPEPDEDEISLIGPPEGD